MTQTPDYRKMTKTQLTALARRKKISVKAGLLKEELVQAVKKGLRKIEAQKKPKVAAKRRKPAATAKTKAAAKKSKAGSTSKKKKVKTSKSKTVRTTRPAKSKTGKTAAKKSSTQKRETTGAKKTARSAPRSQPAKTGLPDRYGDHRLVVLARDPNWAYVYWELDPKQMQDLAPSGQTVRWVLRVYNAPLHSVVDKGAFLEVDINVKDGSYYLDLSRPGARFIVEIGVVDAAGMFRATAQSDAVILPLDHPSDTAASPSTVPSKDSAFPGSSDNAPIPEALTKPRGSRFFKPHSSRSR